MQIGESVRSDWQRLAGNRVLMPLPAMLVPTQTQPSPMGLTGDRGVSVCLSVTGPVHASNVQVLRAGVEWEGSLGSL